MAPSAASATSKKMVVPTQSGVRGGLCTVQATRPASAGSTCRRSRSFPPKNDTSRVPPASPEPVVGVHQEVMASGERSAASTASGVGADSLGGLEAVPILGPATGLGEDHQAAQRVRPALLAHVEAFALRSEAAVPEVERRPGPGLLHLEDHGGADPLRRERRLLDGPHDLARFRRLLHTHAEHGAPGAGRHVEGTSHDGRARGGAPPRRNGVGRAQSGQNGFSRRGDGARPFEVSERHPFPGRWRCGRWRCGRWQWSCGASSRYSQ